MANPLPTTGSEVIDLSVHIEVDLEAKLGKPPNRTTYVDGIKAQQEDGGDFYDKPLGTKDLSTPMKLPLEHFARFSDDVEDFIKAIYELQDDTGSQSQKIRDRVEEILAVVDSAHRLKVIHRFFDKDQPPLMEDVLPDGSNLRKRSVNPFRSRDLQNEWKLHRLWIKWLHRPGLYTEEIAAEKPQLQGLGADELHAIWRSSRYLQELELLNTDRGDRENFPLDHTGPNAFDFRWIWTCRARLNEILTQLAAMAYAPQPLTPAQRQLAAIQGPARTFIAANMNPLPREEMLRYNLRRNPKLLDDLVAFIHNSMVDPERREGPFLRLVMDLLFFEDKFESALAVEHAEDKLINKQVSFLDEDNLSKSKVDTFKQYFPWLLAANPEDDEENIFYKLVEEISLMNRSRRNFRLLRDWTGKRPWHHITQIYDDALPHYQWLTQATQSFKALLNPRCRTARAWDSTTPYEDPPSSIRYISQRLFGFRPILTSDIAMLPAVSRLRFPCELCSKPFIANADFDSSIVGLHCAHAFHLKCIFTYWDAPGKYLHQCPTCGDAAQLNFERVGIDYRKSLNFAHNLMNWNIQHDTIAHIHDDTPAGEAAREAYDVPPMPPYCNRSVIHPNDVKDGALIWWMQQNMLSLCTLENPITWRPMTFLPSQPARITYPAPPGFKTDEILRNTRQYDVLARDLGKRWLSLDFENGDSRRVKPRSKEMLSLNEMRTLPGMRYAPSEEAAWARAQRRRRERKRRDIVRKKGGGVWGL